MAPSSRRKSVNLDLDSLWVGIPDAVEARVATLTNMPPIPPGATEEQIAALRQQAEDDYKDAFDLD